jgi:hypothetical protein
LRSNVFIGLPWPMNSAGIRSGVGRISVLCSSGQYQPCGRASQWLPESRWPFVLRTRHRRHTK